MVYAWIHTFQLELEQNWGLFYKWKHSKSKYLLFTSQSSHLWDIVRIAEKVLHYIKVPTFQDHTFWGFTVYQVLTLESAIVAKYCI